MRLLRFSVSLLLLGACAQSIPETPGVYARVGREWKPLPATSLKPLETRRPTDMKAMQAVVWLAASDEPRVLFVGKVPAPLAVLERAGEGFAPVSAAAVPHESAPNVWELRFTGKAPRGLLILRYAPGTGAALVNGGDAPLALAYGRALRKAGRLDEGEAVLTAAIAAIPQDAALKNELARTYAAAKRDLGAARSLANEAIALAAGDAERALYYDTLGAAYAADADYDKAIEAIDRAISLDLRNPGFHTHLAGLIEKMQEHAPDQVLREFYAALGRSDFETAEDMSNPFDVSRLDDAGQLEAAFQKMARGAPFVNVGILNTIKHGRTVRFKYVLVSQDGGRRTEDLVLQFEKNQWKISLP